MGSQIAHEVMVKWYALQSNRCESGSSPDIDGECPDGFDCTTINETERVVCHDFWDVGLIPADVLRTLYVRLLDTAIDDLAQGEKLVKILMSIRKKKDFDLNIELVQEEVKLNLWVPFIELLRPVLAEYEREGGRMWFKWLCPWDKYDPIEFELNEALKDTSRSDKWRRDAREYLGGLDDYIIQDMHEASAYLTSR